MSRILIIDDDEALAKPLAKFFERYNLTLENATRPSQGIALLQSNDFELVVLDVMLPEMDGFETCRQIRQFSDIPIIMLTARGDVMDRVIGLELGADDYLPKPFEPRELVARINNILKRHHSQPSQEQRLQFGDLRIDPNQETAWIENKEVTLTTSEFQLLSFFIENLNKPLSRDDILNHLKGREVELFTRAVDIQVSRLRQKLKPTDYIRTVWGAGYRFSPPQQS